MSDRDEVDGRSVSSETVEVTFSTLASGARFGHLVGDFNGWATDASPMKLEGEYFTITVRLRPGVRYCYKFLLDGVRWQNDLIADDYRPNSFGGYDSVRSL